MLPLQTGEQVRFKMCQLSSEIGQQFRLNTIINIVTKSTVEKLLFTLSCCKCSGRSEVVEVVEDAEGDDVEGDGEGGSEGDGEGEGAGAGAGAGAEAGAGAGADLSPGAGFAFPKLLALIIRIIYFQHQI